MKKTIIKLLIIIGLISIISILNANAGNINIGDISGINKITQTSIEKTGDTDIVKAANDIGFSLLRIAKIILQALLVVYIVYVGGKMIMSMGSDEGELTKAKSQLWYSLIAIVFINVPGVMYEAITFSNGNKNINGGVGGTFVDPNSKNILVNMDLFGNGFLANIVSALEVFIFIIAVYVIIMAGIKMMTARGRDEKIKEGKEKLLYSIFAMIFVGFIEAWKQVATSGKITGGEGSATYIFGKAIDMSLLIAGPVAMIFLTYAGYIYITSNGDEDKVKKAKSIIINTLLATLLLITMVTFLNDLITL
ncbi:MAG: hypothetical protein Q9M97_07955 [Candidatus Gracilibacteria bacterium]|nr:hypothetical protein [Candidatus Gracilibacteria bacterium]